MYHGDLFSKQPFHQAETAWRETLIREIQSYDMASVISRTADELVKYFEERFIVKPPMLKKDEIYLLDEPKEITSTERVRDRIWTDEYVNVNHSYIQFTVCIPFEGDASLLDLQPTSFSYTYGKQMKVSIRSNNIQISYQEEMSGQDPEKLYEGDLTLIETNLANLKRDADNFNKSLLPLIKQEIDKRKQKAEANQSIIQSFKIPIKKRDDVPTTYSIPEIRKKPSIIESPKIKTFTPEPTLGLEEYENILSIIKDMALAMERSPHTFSTLDEETIRNFFIILLNGHYQGNATGETFNGIGKTDILIRHKNANAFIAECKFWKGEKKMTEGINQLLGYVTWRDTKTSMVLFNKQTDFSSVIEKAKETIKQHKNFKSEYHFTNQELERSETIFGYKFIHPNDQDKEIFLTLMGFQITKPSVDNL
jgi:hypothetical protein